MRLCLGIDLGSTTTKAVLLDEEGHAIGRGITNSRSNYHLAADIARDEALNAARFALVDRNLEQAGETGVEAVQFRKRLGARFRLEQRMSQLQSLRERALSEAESGGRFGEKTSLVVARLESLFDEVATEWRRLRLGQAKSDFFRDQAASDYNRLAAARADRDVPFDALLGVFDKTISLVENERLDLGFDRNIGPALQSSLTSETSARRTRYEAAVQRAATAPLDIVATIGTGYGRQTLPFAKDQIRSEILCHGLGAHAMYPRTATVLDIGGQDTKAIQVDDAGIVTSFSMNDRCAAGCGRYLGYIADEMNLGVHELGPLALESTRHVKINSTCTVFAGAELRDRLTLGQKREDILAGLHRAIILRAMALLARSGGVGNEFTFTGGVANNGAAVKALRQLVAESYGDRTINISPESIYTGALGAAMFAQRAVVAPRVEEKSA